MRISDWSSDVCSSDLLIAEIRRRNLRVSYLVNNAGVTVEGRFLDHAWEQQRAFVQLMSTSPAELIHAFLPEMLKAKSGKVLNIASLGEIGRASCRARVCQYV